MSIQSVSIIKWASQFAAIWIPIIYFLILLIISPLHRVFIEFGGVMQFFAGKEILRRKGYNGWASFFWPPLFSILIGLLSKIFSGFFAGKLLSITSSSLMLLVAHSLAIELTGNTEIALLTQVFLALSPMYFMESLRAHNHMLDSLLFVLGMTLFIKSISDPTLLAFIFAGLICGLAGFSRYTSNILLILPLSLFLLYIPSHAISFAIAFLGGFSIISIPWWVYNFRKHGKPINTLQHLNACTAIVPGQSQGTLYSLWWCVSESDLNSMLDILIAYPREYIYNFVRNIMQSVKSLMIYAGVLAPFMLPGIFESLFIFEIEYWIIVFGLLLLYIFIISQIFVTDWIFLSWSVLITIVSTMFVHIYLNRIYQELSFLNMYNFQALFIAFLILISIGLIVFQLRRILNTSYTTASKDIVQVSQALIEYDNEIEDKIIMAVDPARAYYTGAKYINTPLCYDGPVEGLVSYSGISEKVKQYAPKYPSTIETTDIRADYLIYSRLPDLLTDQQDLPHYSFLLDANSDLIPENFKMIYQTTYVVIYEIVWN